MTAVDLKQAKLIWLNIMLTIIAQNWSTTGA